MARVTAAIRAYNVGAVDELGVLELPGEQLVGLLSDQSRLLDPHYSLCGFSLALDRERSEDGQRVRDRICGAFIERHVRQNPATLVTVGLRIVLH